MEIWQRDVDVVYYDLRKVAGKLFNKKGIVFFLSLGV